MRFALPQMRGVYLLGLVVVTIAYSAWYSSPGGAFGQLSGLAEGMPLQSQMGYSAQAALDAYGQVEQDGKSGLVFHALLLDIPYMILNCLSFAGLIGFGLRHLNLGASPLRWAAILPTLALLIDMVEDTILAMFMATLSPALAAVAGPITLTKIIIWAPTMGLALLLGLGGVVAWGVRRLKT